MENIQRFKTDTYSVLRFKQKGIFYIRKNPFFLFRCIRELGQNNSAFIALLLPKLLPMHSYLDVQEPQFSKIDR